MVSNQVNRYKSFEDVNNLEEAKINRLLQDGDEPEKVWAIWSLAMKKGESSVPEFKSLCDEEPSPGVRRNLIVVLAGMHQTDLLYGLAKYDPDAFVRADALQYLIRTAPQNDTLSKFLHERLKDDSENIVRTRVLEEAPQKLLNLSFNHLFPFIEPPNPELQNVSLEQLEKRISINNEEASLLAKLLLKDHSADILEKIASILFHSKKFEFILQAGMTREEKTGFDPLMYLIIQKIKFPWEVLQKYVDQKNGPDSHVILEFIENPAYPETFLWLSKKYAQILELESEDNEFQKIFSETLPDLNKPDQMSPSLASDLKKIQEHLKEELFDMQHDHKFEWLDENYDYDEEEYEKALSNKQTIIEILENWLR